MQQSATQATEQAGGAAKGLYACRICAHANIPDSVFCSACGTPFLTAPCPQCGAETLVTKSACGQCHAAMAKPASAEKPVPRRPVRLTTVVLGVGAAVVATMAILGYSAFEILSFGYMPLDRTTLPSDAAGAGEQRRGKGEVGTKRPDSAAGSPSADKRDREDASSPVPASTTHGVPDGAAQAVVTVPPAAGRPATESAAGSCAREARVLGLCADSGQAKK